MIFIEIALLISFKMKNSWFEWQAYMCIMKLTEEYTYKYA